MIDYFALFEQPRKPRIDPGALKEKYHELARRSHPDQAASGNDSTLSLASLNEGYRVLLDPKLRLIHLLDLAGVAVQTSAVPQELSEIFLETGTLIQDIDRVLTKSADTALSKALIRSEISEKLKLTGELLARFHQLRENALKALDVLDRNWASARDQAAVLSDLSSRFAYLSRWMTQLEERQARLSM